MKILLLEPFLTGSHKRWAEELQRVSIHEVKILSLPGRHWKWRMHGGAISLAKAFLSEPWQPDLILATDMLDLSVFLALTRQRLSQVPTVIYFHENQLTYPWSASDPDITLQRDRHYGFINLSSALVADAVWFNSHFHQKIFLSAAAEFLQVLPDYQEKDIIEQIRVKSRVMHLGVDLQKFDSWKTGTEGPATLLWNHRWEYDKNPQSFFQTLFRLQKDNIDFRLIVLGESFRKSPPIFTHAKSVLAKQLIHFGFVKDFKTYARYLWQADVLPVTSNQDFFGISAVEAIYCNCFPLLPNRLAFPEHLPEGVKATHLYQNEEDLYDNLKDIILNIRKLRANTYQHFVSRYDWRNLGSHYDKAFEQLFLDKNRT